MASDSESYFHRTLRSRTKAAREAVQECVSAFLSSSPDRRQASVTSALASVERLVELLQPSDRPDWLDPLHNSLPTASTHAEDHIGVTAIQRIANDLQVALNKHAWDSVGHSAKDGFDFDSLYEKYKAEFRIPELFDNIISALHDIVASGTIENIRMLNELNRIIATLQKARSGSYFATRSAWLWVAIWFKNTGWELLSDIPVAGAGVRGLRKTLEDMDSGMMSMDSRIQSDLKSQLAQDFPHLEYRSPQLPMLENNIDFTTDQIQ